MTGAIEISITYPTEYVKTKLQLDESSSKGGGQRQYSGPVDCIKKTWKSHGFFGFFAIKQSAHDSFTFLPKS